MTSADDYVRRIQEALRSGETDTPLGQALMRLREPVIVGEAGQWRYEGFVAFLSGLHQTMRAIDPTLPAGLPSHCLDPAQIARFFRVPLEQFNWQGVEGGTQAGFAGRIEAKLDRILDHTGMLLRQKHELHPPSSIGTSSALTKAEVARRFRVSTRTLDRWRSMGFDLGEIVIAGTVRFDGTKIASIIATQKVRRRRRNS